MIDNDRFMLHFILLEIVSILASGSLARTVENDSLISRH